jgi:hypothetical protein
MVLVFIGLHGAGKSYLSSYIALNFGWKVYVKRNLLMLLHNRLGARGDWVSWYRDLYTVNGSYSVMRMVLTLIPFVDNDLIIDSIHGFGEWRAIKERWPDAVLASVITPKAVREQRNRPETTALDVCRISFWHEGGVCLTSESEWCFNGAAPIEAQRIEFESFLNHFSALIKNTS